MTSTLAAILNQRIKFRRETVSVWLAENEGDMVFLQMNDFPDEHLWTVFWRDEVKSFDNEPVHWIIPKGGAESFSRSPRDSLRKHFEAKGVRVK